MPGELGVLDVHRRTAFIFDDRGRMLCERAPDRTRGRRFSFSGCCEGNLAVVRDDVSDVIAEQVEALVADEPPLFASDATPRHVERYAALLDSEAQFGLLWRFPASLESDGNVHLVWSGSDEAYGLLRDFDRVMPKGLVEIGFRQPGDLWEPWCAAVVDGTVASIAETVRSGTDGAEVGLDTAPAFRGRGLGAATTAGWSTHPELGDRMLFYSTGRANSSSRRVTERLGLSFLGSTFAVP